MRLILVHSSGLGPRQWGRLTPLLDIEPLLPALSGYDDEPLRPNFTWRDDLAILRQVVQPNDIVFGHSYGGFLALQLALVSPIAGLIIHEPAAIGVLHNSDFTLNNFFELPPEGEAGWIHRLVNWWNGPNAWDGLNARARAPFLERAAKVFAEVHSISTDETPASAYAHIHCPAVMSWARGSRPEAVQMARDIAASMPNARAVALDGVGHMAPVTHPSLFVPFINDVQHRIAVSQPQD